MQTATLNTESIIYARTAWNDMPIFYPYITEEKPKKRPKKEAKDKNAPRMVTIRELSDLTGVSQYTIRKLCRDGIIQFLKAGTKYLINYNRFLDYLNGSK